MLHRGDKVEKVGGDYVFIGVVVAVFAKLSGVVRIVVEDDRGVLFIFSEKNLRRVEGADPAKSTSCTELATKQPPPNRRTVSEVRKAQQNAVAGGCCNRFADQLGCSCLAEAVPDEPARRCGICQGVGMQRGRGGYRPCPRCNGSRRQS
jgi:hypothetical protein